MISVVTNRGTRVRFLLSGFLGLGILAFEQVLPGRLSDEARELSWLSASKDKLADSTPDELARWQHRAMPAVDSTLTDWQATIGPDWEWQQQDEVTFRVSGSSSTSHNWVSILEGLKRLESLPGLLVERVQVTATQGGQPALRIEITVRRLNEEPVAIRGRPIVPGRFVSGSAAASRVGPTPGQVRCS